MSVESTITKVIYVGNGVATEWAVPFKYNKPEHLHLLVTDAAGAHELVTSNFQVQVTEAGDTSIVYPVSGQPLPAGKRLTIFRATPQTQIVDLIYGGAFAPEVLEEDGLDREVMMIQELQEGLDRAVKVDMDSDQSPEELRDDLFAARDTAVDSATSAAANANAAADSAQSAAGSAAIATEQREAACICAGEAQDARDVAIAQTEAANILMEAELAKVNAIVAANKTDQQAAVTAARQWAEKAPDVPVDYDEDGNPHYSARHWAENAQKIAIEPPTAERRGAIRVGAGLHLETGANGETDTLTADKATEDAPGIVQPDGATVTVDEDGLLSAHGGHLLLNSEQWITASGTFVAPVGGWFEVLLINGGQGGNVSTTYKSVGGGRSGDFDLILVWLEAGQEVPVTIGAGTAGQVMSSGSVPRGGVTSFGQHSPRFANHFSSSTVNYISVAVENSGAGPGALTGHDNPSNGQFYGAGGGAYYGSSSSYRAGAGHQGAARVRWHDPAKAAGPLPAPALFSARRAAAPRTAAQPATVNLYDPETGQGSVWREEDAEAKLAEGMISEVAWQEICAEKAAEEYAAWLVDPETEPERFELLRAARKVKLAEYDVAVAELRRKERAGADVTAQLAAWDAYAVTLCDLPAQAGAPWDGGGELTPWPEMPAVSNAQGQQ